MGCDEVWLERLQWRDPGCYVGGERLVEERVEWLVFLVLDVVRVPVVDEREVEYVLVRCVRLDPRVECVVWVGHEV